MTGFSLNSVEQQICLWLEQHHAEMVDSLKTLVNLESGSTDIEGVRNVRNQIAIWLEKKGILTERIETDAGLPALWASVGNEAQEPAIFLTGHMDTVFSSGTVAERPFRQDGERAYGPGVADMKSGLVMNIFVLMAFHELERQEAIQISCPIKILFTPDEEIGSLQGRQLIQQYIRGAQAVFNAEPARMNGNLVSARKGGDSFSIEVKGRAAHAGVNHDHGISAIEALARIISKVHALTDYSTGITTNIGVIQGGQTSNTIADKATAKLDVRFVQVAQRDDLHAQLLRCVAEHGVDGAIVTLTHLAGFLPFEDKWSAELLAQYQQQAQRIGFEVDGEFTGGCSDAGWTSALEVPTLCGTGPIGGWAHTDREFCELSSFVPRAQALALLILSNQHSI